MSTEMTESFKRWTAKRKIALVLSSSTYFAQKSDPSDGNTRKTRRFSDFFVVARFLSV